MQGLMRQIGVGLTIGGLGFAIAACRPVSDTAPPDTTAPAASVPTDAEPDTAETPEPPATEPADPSASATPTPETPPTAARPNTTPPPLPAECNNPQTQMAMNRCAEAEYQQVDARLNQVYQSVKGSLGAAQRDRLIDAELAWIEFRDRNCEFVQAQFEGGSIQPVVYYGCMTQTTQDRTAELQQPQPPSQSYAIADQRLNEVYQNLRGTLSAPMQERLTTAQLAWLDYRDLHCAYAGGDESACLARITETRTARLLEQFENYSL